MGTKVHVPWPLLRPSVHLCQVGIRRRTTIRGKALFDVAKAANELLVRSAQTRLGIEFEVARYIGDDEQEVTKLFLYRVSIGF